jgi:hypothetical protein
MWIRYLIGGLFGCVAGGVIGYVGQCSGGG